MSIYLPTYLSTYLPSYLPTYLSIYLSICLLIYLSIYLSGDITVMVDWALKTNNQSIYRVGVCTGTAPKAPVVPDGLAVL